MLRKSLLPLLLLSFVASLSAKEEIWINFSSLPSGYLPQAGEVYERQYASAPVDPADPTQLDYSNLIDPVTQSNISVLPSRFQNQAASDGSLSTDRMKQSLALDRWQVELSSSSAFLPNLFNSYAVAYNVSQNSSQYAGEQILAVRFSLPDLRVNTRVYVTPEFKIPAYSMPVGSDLASEYAKPPFERMGQFLNSGVLRNVGEIRSIKVVVYGRRFPFDLYVLGEKSDKGNMVFNMGSLNFSGWNEMVWNNPNYPEDLRDRRSFPEPEYPGGSPDLIFRGFRIDRKDKQDGGDGVFYVKEVRVEYDTDSPDYGQEIEDERIWNIQSRQSEFDVMKEAKKMADQVVMRYEDYENAAVTSSVVQSRESPGQQQQ